MQTLSKSIFSFYPEIEVHTNLRKTAIAIGLLFSGILFFVSAFEIHSVSMYIGLTMFISGIIIFLSGIYTLIWKCKDYVYIPTGSILKSYSFSYKPKDLETLNKILVNSFQNIGSTILPIISGTLKLDVLLSSDKNFAVAQLSKFEENRYNPISPVYYYKDFEAQAAYAFFFKK